MARAGAYELRIATPAAVTASDAGGYPVEADAAEAVVRGSFDLLAAREVERAAAMGIRAEASARVSRGTAVTAASLLTVQGRLPKPDPEIAGEWQVEAVQRQRTHLRVLVRRPG